MTDLMQMIVRLQGYLPALDNLATGVSWIIGILLVVSAILGAGKRSEMGTQGGSWASPIGRFLTGVAFIALPSVITLLSYSFFGSAPTNASAIFAYAPQTIGLFEEGSEAKQIITAITAVAMFVGVIAIMRGIYMLNMATQPNNQTGWGPGIVFLAAGTLAVNFPKFVGMMEKWISG